MSSFNDTLTGSAMYNSLGGASGVDMLWGQDRADKLTGGGGNGTLHGESGSD